MADTTEMLASLEKLFETTKDPALGEFIERVKAGTASILDLGVASTRMSEEVQVAIEKITEGAKRVAASFGDFGDVVDKVLGGGGVLFRQLTSHVTDFIKEQMDAGMSVEQFGIKTALAMEPMLGVIPRSITGMGELGKSGYDAGQSISEAFVPLGEQLQKMKAPTALIRFLETSAELTSSAYGLQREIIGLAVAQGNLSGVVSDTDKGFTDMNLAMVQMQDLAYDSAVATGQTVSATMNLAKALGTIPDALTTAIDVEGQQINQIVLTSQVATAFGKRQSEVAEDLKKMYTDMGLRGAESFEVIAKLYTAAGDSKLRFGAFTESVMAIASSFKILGDNTEAATDVVKAFDTAFKDSDISPAAMQEVITGLTEGVFKMERGTQAFIAAQTGGPGGLAGAFEIELAMQEGRMDEVIERTMRAMQAQFGGEVLTLKDAAQNPALAGEFYKQVQYLTQVAGVARSDREAYKILEAMKTGVMDMLRPGAEGTERADTLANVQERGTAEQMRTTSAVMRVHQTLEGWRAEQREMAVVANERLNNLTGIEDRMDEYTRIAGSKGVMALGTTPEARSRVAFDPEKYSEYLATRLADVLSEEGIVGQIGAAFSTFGERAGRLGFGGVGLAASAGKTEMERWQRMMLTTTPVGVPETLPPGTRAGMGTLHGGAEIPLPAPATPGAMLRGAGAGAGAVNPMEYFMERGEFPRIEHSPIEINVNFTEPFNQKVKTIAEGVYEEKVGGKTRQGKGGNAMRK